MFRNTLGEGANELVVYGIRSMLAIQAIVCSYSKLVWEHWNTVIVVVSLSFSWCTETAFLFFNLDKFLQARIKPFYSSLQSLPCFSTSLNSKGATTSRRRCLNWMFRWRRALKVRGTGKMYFIMLIGMLEISSLFW